MTTEPGHSSSVPVEPGAAEGTVEPDQTDEQFEVEGRLTDASNLTVRVRFTDADGQFTGERGLYKPVRGEAPLRDFPDGTLGHREVAAYRISELGGWGLVPRTVLTDGPLGPGSVQRWVDWEPTGRQPGDGLLEIFPAGDVPAGWRPVVHGEGAQGQAVVVAHQDAPDLASLAVLDLVLNNADRKGAHLLRDADGHLWGVDHGLTLHHLDKLRTVLWGWAGEALPAEDVTRLQRLDAALDIQPADPGSPGDGGQASAGYLSTLISADELSALRARVTALLADPVFPELPTDRYPLPWPLW